MTFQEALARNNAGKPVAEHDMRAYRGWKRSGCRRHAWARYGGPAQYCGWTLAQAPADADRYSSTGNPDQIHAFASPEDVPSGWVIIKNWADPRDRRGV